MASSARPRRYRCAGASYVFSQMDGPHTDLPQFLINSHRVDDAGDMNAYVARIRESARALDQALERARLNAGEGVRPPRFAYDAMILQARAVVDRSAFRWFGRLAALGRRAEQDRRAGRERQDRRGAGGSAARLGARGAHGTARAFLRRVHRVARSRSGELGRDRGRRLEAPRRRGALRRAARHRDDDDAERRRDPRDRIAGSRTPHGRDGSGEGTARVRRQLAGALRVPAQRRTLLFPERRLGARGVPAGGARRSRRHTAAAARLLRPVAEGGARREARGGVPRAARCRAALLPRGRRRLASRHLLRAFDRHERDAETAAAGDRLSRGHSRPPLADLDPTGAHGRSDVSHAGVLHRVRRRLGALFRAAREGDGGLRGSVRGLQPPDDGDLARGAARRRYRAYTRKTGASNRPSTTSRPTRPYPRAKYAPRYGATS